MVVCDALGSDDDVILVVVVLRYLLLLVTGGWFGCIFGAGGSRFGCEGGVCFVSALAGRSLVTRGSFIIEDCWTAAIANFCCRTLAGCNFFGLVDVLLKNNDRFHGTTDGSFIAIFGSILKYGGNFAVVCCCCCGGDTTCSAVNVLLVLEGDRGMNVLA